MLLLIAIRVWHLAVVQHDTKVEEASRPQRRTVVEKAERATIQDRHGEMLALNKVQYNASICYAPIREVPRTAWERGENGKKVKKFVRKEYIIKLSHLLSELLHLDPDDVEDLIHAKAAILGNVPCTLQEDIDEATYFKLKMLEREWPGIVAEVSAKRHYPQGKVAGELVGYIGHISQEQYRALMEEMHHLREEEAFEELEQLEKRAYSINDLTGKVGVEAAFDDSLRGLSGKKVFLSDIRGNFLRPLPGGEEAKPGEALRLALSAKLQAYAEQLLVEYEQEAPSQSPAQVRKRHLIPPHQPWIKGGAIVVMDPKSGEVLAMASHPRFDPNEFIRRSEKVSAILESERAISMMWDYKMPLVRERFDFFSGLYTEEEMPLTWENYLRLIFPEKSTLCTQLETFGTVRDALFVQQQVAALLALFDPQIDSRKVFDMLYEGVIGMEFTIPERDYFARRTLEVAEEIARLKSALDPYFSPLDLNYEKILLVDLYSLLVDPENPPPQLDQPLAEVRDLSGHLVPVLDAVHSIVRTLFRENVFKPWRQQNFKSYLATKRKEEKAAKRKFARPYIDYLKEKERELFNQFWEEYKWQLLATFLTGKGKPPFASELKLWADELAQGAYPALEWRAHYTALQEHPRLLTPSYLQTLRPFEALAKPLIGRYGALRGHTQKDLAAAFYPRYGHGIARSHAYRQATVIGSIFKLVPAYEAMRQKYLRALEEGRNPIDLNPLVIIDDKHQVSGKGWNVGFTTDGRPIPLFYRGGRLPRSEHTGVGRVDVVRALETSSNPYFSMLAGDIIDDPEDLLHAANLLGYGEKTGIDLPGEYSGILPQDVVYDRTGLYSMAIGQHSMVGTPLQTAVMLCALANGGKVLKPQIVATDEPEVRWEVFMPQEIQRKLVEGMQRVVMGDKGTARFMRNSFPLSLCERFVGKTSTAEVMERYGLDGKHGKLKAKEIWFGGILYHDKECRDPEVVIVVYLKQGVFGRLAAPLAFKIAQKYEEIVR